MHAAVELLLSRMKSNPEEFAKGSVRRRRWDKIISDFDTYLTDEERQALRDKYSEIQMNQMHKDVMAELLHGAEEIEDPFAENEAERQERLDKLIAQFRTNEANKIALENQIKKHKLGINPFSIGTTKLKRTA